MIDGEDVIIIQKASEDLAAGRIFYERLEHGVGQYFVTSLIGDIESLKFQAGAIGET